MRSGCGKFSIELCRSKRGNKSEEVHPVIRWNRCLVRFVDTGQAIEDVSLSRSTSTDRPKNFFVLTGIEIQKNACFVAKANINIEFRDIETVLESTFK